MTTIYREYDTNTRQLKVLNSSVSGGIRGDDNSLKIVFIYTDDAYLEDKKAYIVFDVVDPETNNLYTFSEDTTPKFDGYVFTVPAELLQQKGMTQGYIHFQLGFIKLSDSLGDVVFSQSQIDYLEFTAANTLILRDSLSSDLSQAPSYYAWAEYYKEHGILDGITIEETPTGSILRFPTYTGAMQEIPLHYVKLDADGKIADSIFPKITVTETHNEPAHISVEQADRLIKLSEEGKIHGLIVRKDENGEPIDIVCYLTEVVEGTNGKQTIPKFYVRKTVTVTEDGIDREHSRFFECDVMGNVKYDPDNDFAVIANLNPFTEGKFNELIDRFLADREAGNDSDEDEVYGYYTVNFQDKVVPVFTIYYPETEEFHYFTYLEKLDEDGTIRGREWFKCDENGAILTYDEITETTEIAFEEKENKINNWAEYKPQTNLQYPTAKLVYESLKSVGRVDSVLTPYTYVAGVATTGKFPVEGGAIYDVIENERVARMSKDAIIDTALNSLTAQTNDLDTRLKTNQLLLKSTVERVDTLEDDVEKYSETVESVDSRITSTSADLRSELTTAIDKYFIDSTKTDEDGNETKHVSVLSQRLAETSSAITNSLTNTTNSLYQQMNNLKNEVVGNVTSTLTTLKTDVSTLQSSASTQTRELEALGENFTSLAKSIESVKDNLTVDFSRYDLVTVNKAIGKIDESLLPDTAITEFFGPVNSHSALTTITRKKTIARVEKIPVYIKQTKKVTKKTDTDIDRWVLFKCLPYKKRIGDAEYQIEYEIYTVGDDGSLNLKYRLCPQFEGTAFMFYDGTTANGTAIPKFYASSIYADTPAYTIFQGTTSNALYSVTSKVVATRTDVQTTLKYVYDEDGITPKTNVDGTPVFTEQEEEVVVNTYEYQISEYATGKVLFSGVNDKASGLTDEDGKVILNALSPTGKQDVIRLYETVTEVTEEVVETGETVPKVDELGAIVYDTMEDIRRLEPTAVDDLTFVGDSTLYPRNRQEHIFSLIEDGTVVYLCPKLAEDYSAEDSVTPALKHIKIGNTTYPLYSVRRQLGNVAYDVYEFYVVTYSPVAEGYVIAETTKTRTTYITEYVYPQRGDMAIVKGSARSSEDGTYLLGLSDVDGHTYSSVLDHWVKLSSPQAYWGQVFGNPSASTVNGLKGTIEDQKDLMLILNEKAPKFTPGNGISEVEDEATGKTVLGHTKTLTKSMTKGTTGDGNIKALGITSDEFGHIMSLRETIIYPPQNIGQYTEESGSDYWGVAKDANGKNVCQWITPLSEVTKDSTSLVTSGAIYQKIYDVNSLTKSKIDTDLKNRQKSLTIERVELAMEAWGIDGDAYIISVATTNAEIIPNNCEFLLNFDMVYLAEAMRCEITLDPRIPSMGTLMFRATSLPQSALKANVLVIPKNA